MTVRVLILGGTATATELAGRCAGHPGWQVITSLAGRTANPTRPPGALRIGGFGGAQGLHDYLRTTRVDVVIDATHPFAARITAQAAAACAASRTPLLIVRPPGWIAGPGDHWLHVPTAAAAAHLVATDPDRLWPGATVLLTLGSSGPAAFAADHDHHFVVRAISAPAGPVPPHCTILRGRGPFTAAAELALLREHAVGVLVTKDSGTPATAAKLGAAAALHLPVVMIERPPVPGGAAVVTDALRAELWVAGLDAAAGPSGFSPRR